MKKILLVLGLLLACGLTTNASAQFVCNISDYGASAPYYLSCNDSGMVFSNVGLSFELHVKAYRTGSGPWDYTVHALVSSSNGSNPSYLDLTQYDNHPNEDWSGSQGFCSNCYAGAAAFIDVNQGTLYYASAYAKISW